VKQEFKLARGWFYFVVIITGLLSIGIPIGAFNIILNASAGSETAFYVMAFLLCESLFLFLLALAVKNKVVVDEEKIVYTGVFISRTLHIGDIKGFKVDDNYLYFFPQTKRLKKIKVSTYFGRFQELILWAKIHCRDLDQEQFEEDQGEILGNENYGDSVDERLNQLAKAKSFTRVYTGISLVIAFATILFPNLFYEAQIVLCAIIPLVTVLIPRFSKGLIKLFEKKGSAFPNVTGAFLLPPIALMLRSLTDFTLLDYNALWLPCGIVFSLFSLLVFSDAYSKYDFSKPIGYFGVLGVLIISAAYSYGVVGTSNATFDNSVPNLFKAEVLDKRKSSGKTTTYYLELSPWGPQTEIEDVHVSSRVYGYYSVGDTAYVYYSQGLFGVSYFIVQ